MSKSEPNVHHFYKVVDIILILLYLANLSIMLVFYFSERDLSNYVHHSNCYQPISDYSVEPGKSSTSILTNCGANKQERCIRTSTSLSDAIHFANSNQADKFSYNEKTGNTALLSKTSTNYIDQIYTSIFTKNKQIIQQNTDGTTEILTTDQTTTTGNRVPFVNVRTLQTS